MSPSPNQFYPVVAFQGTSGSRGGAEAPVAIGVGATRSIVRRLQRCDEPLLALTLFSDRLVGRSHQRNPRA
jgi:hypothetical protein